MLLCSACDDEVGAAGGCIDAVRNDEIAQMTTQRDSAGATRSISRVRATVTARVTVTVTLYAGQVL